MTEQSTKFCAIASWQNTINTVEAERETETSIWVKGRRRAKRSNYENYFDTWSEAHAFLLAQATTKLDLAKTRMSNAQSALEAVKAMTSEATQ